jgi:plasmid stabilization system protein ParE
VADIHLAPEVLDDFDRIFDHLAAVQVGDASARVGEIVQALQILAGSPLIGRPVKGGKRELVIGKHSHGYVALYRYIADVDAVFVLAVRGQRESGYKGQD